MVGFNGISTQGTSGIIKKFSPSFTSNGATPSFGNNGEPQQDEFVSSHATEENKSSLLTTIAKFALVGIAAGAGIALLHRGWKHLTKVDSVESLEHAVTDVNPTQVEHTPAPVRNESPKTEDAVDKILSGAKNKPENLAENAENAVEGTVEETKKPTRLRRFFRWLLDSSDSASAGTAEAKPVKPATPKPVTPPPAAETVGKAADEAVETAEDKPGIFRWAWNKATFKKSRDARAAKKAGAEIKPGSLAADEAEAAKAGSEMLKDFEKLPEATLKDAFWTKGEGEIIEKGTSRELSLSAKTEAIIKYNKDGMRIEELHLDPDGSIKARTSYTYEINKSGGIDSYKFRTIDNDGKEIMAGGGNSTGRLKRPAKAAETALDTAKALQEKLDEQGINLLNTILKPMEKDMYHGGKPFDEVWNSELPARLKKLNEEIDGKFDHAIKCTGGDLLETIQPDCVDYVTARAHAKGYNLIAEGGGNFRLEKQAP